MDPRTTRSSQRYTKYVLRLCTHRKFLVVVVVVVAVIIIVLITLENIAFNLILKTNKSDSVLKELSCLKT